jgi:ABC-2 type transport system ATP-binding protein
MASVTATASGQWQAVPGALEVHHPGTPERAAPSPPEMQAVVLSDVTVRYPRSTESAVDGLSLAIPPGQIFGLLGPNGSGKTTTINMIVGQLTPGSGHVEVFGQDPKLLATHWDFGLLEQGTAFYTKLSGRYNLDFHARLYGYTGEDRETIVNEALRLANLEQVADQPAGSYSGGMARRLAIARALLHSPRLVILDEPTTGIDPTERAELWQHIQRLPEAGKTVLLTTHDLDEAEALCDLVAIMRKGRLTTSKPASPDYLREHYGAMVITIRARAGDGVRGRALAALDAVPGITQTRVTAADGEPGEFVITATASVQKGIVGSVVMTLGRSGVDILDVDKRKPTLEEVFRVLTTGPLQAGP